MTINIVALILVLFTSCLYGDSLFTSIQMLWLNLIMDTFAALALATDAPCGDIMERQPVSRFE